jgi:hypothetical protein
MIRSMRDVEAAHNEGRVHLQRFLKNTGAIGDAQWQDWSFASGQPAYDARIGVAGAFTPFVAAKNDAIFFPDIPAGMERRIDLIRYTTTASSTGQTSVEFCAYDLLGVYPLIDGDSLDLQEMDNTNTLPRYIGGQGVRAVLVNHVAPSVATAVATVNYTNSQGVLQTVNWNCGLFGQNKVCYAETLGAAAGPLFCRMAAGDSGIDRIDSLQFQTAPGGLWAIYLVKPLTTFGDRSNPLKVANEKHLTFQNSFHMPKVENGAWLGFFYMPLGSSRSVAMYGDVEFIWG